MLFGWMKSLIFYLLLATIVTHMAPSINISNISGISSDWS